MSSAALAWRAEVSDELERTRRRTLALVEPLSEAALRRQVREFMSPLLWDLIHVARFEKLWLIDAVQGASGAQLDAAYDALRTPRRQRSVLDMPTKQAVLEELATVRANALEVLETVPENGAAEAGDERGALLRNGYVYRMIIQHEGQHQETMLQALDLPAADWVYEPAPAVDHEAGAVDDEARVLVPEGTFRMGTNDRGSAYDNERAAHDVPVAGFAIDRYPATNRRWLEFIGDGGYRRGELWSEGGKRWLRDRAARCPQGWVEEEGEWGVCRFGHRRPLRLDEAVQHICFWEAEAFASWCGGRLPSEKEWEKAAAWGPGANAPRKLPWGDVPTLPGRAGEPAGHPLAAGDGPGPVGGRPHLASAYGVEGLLGGVYEWTRSPFAPYPGFAPFPYREYSAVFFGDTYRVLRGAAWTAHPSLWRNTYRNWDLPQRRQVFAGVRVAYDLD